MPARQQHTHTEDWSTIRQLCLWKEQVVYEQIRPVVLFGDVPAEHAQQTGDNERTLRRQADSFDQAGISQFRNHSSSVYEDIVDGFQRRKTVVHLHAQGWTRGAAISNCVSFPTKQLVGSLRGRMAFRRVFA